MKIRMGFVSNSSSASFCIKRKYLTDAQTMAIKGHYLSADFEQNGCTQVDRWNIHTDSTKIRGYTSMTNFDMREYLEKIGVNEEHIDWEED